MSNESDQSYFYNSTSEHPAVGIIYTCFGIYGIIQNILTAVLIATDKEMKNPTYFYMINQCLADATMLVPIGVLCGLVLIDPQQFLIPTLIKIGAYIMAASWNPSCIFMVLMSYSRYVQLNSPPTILSTNHGAYHKSKKLWASLILPWLIPAVIYFWALFYDPPPMILSVSRYSWILMKTAFGDGIKWLTIVWAICIVLSISYFNGKSLLVVHRMRKNVRDAQFDHNMKRELKLFLQCALTAAIYSSMVLTFFILGAFESKVSRSGFIAAQLLWIFNHAHSPLIYFCLNKRLRQRLFQLFRFGSCKISTKTVSVPRYRVRPEVTNAAILY